MDKRTPPWFRNTRYTATRFILGGCILTFSTLVSFSVPRTTWGGDAMDLPLDAANILAKCRSLHAEPGPASDFSERTESDRFVLGTPPVLISNATLWTGRDNGHEILVGDILLENGLIKRLGNFGPSELKHLKGLVRIEANGKWVTPGIVDMHSHLGVDSVPELRGASDTNSFKGLVLPWLRSLDGLNTHDEAYALSISGGVTTANVLPGSADAIGGQAFTIKLRQTQEKSPSSMVLEPPHSLNGTYHEYSTLRWRQMKHACGENPSRVYSGTRMDTNWAFRQGYDTARKIKNKQDAYCSKALTGEWEGIGEYPDSIEWEALVDVLRGRVKVHIHCYEAVDLDAIVRLSNEFQFSVAAFHHAHETYLVPDLLRKAYGKTPGVALFATNARYKREAYRGSEFAPRILADKGFKVVMKSDHPVLNSRFLLYEAQQAHYYGLSPNLALASVTSTPATILGYDHRIGYLKERYDADIVLWDSHPLSLGATPTQVFIDGVPQLHPAETQPKSKESQRLPSPPNFDKETQAAIDWDGLPPLELEQAGADIVVFTNVSSLFLKKDNRIEEVFSASNLDRVQVVTEQGLVTCYGHENDCAVTQSSSIKQIDLEGGSISPSLIGFGGGLGLRHIDAEASANDGYVRNLLASDAPKILGEQPVIRAVDGLVFSTRDALLAYRSGVTTGIAHPDTRGFISGISAAFGTGLPHRLVKGAIIQEETAFHIEITSSGPSISTQVAALRNIFLGEPQGDLGKQRTRVLEGALPLVIHVESADVIATIIQLKKDIEDKHKTIIKLTITGAAEAHLLAQEIKEANIGVVVNPSRPFPASWSERRILPGPPLTKSSISVLLAHNITVGIGIQEQWSARNIRFDIAWAALEASDEISKSRALELASINLEQLLGIEETVTDLVAVRQGTILGFEGKVVAILSPERGVVDLVP